MIFSFGTYPPRNFTMTNAKIDDPFHDTKSKFDDDEKTIVIPVMQYYKLIAENAMKNQSSEVRQNVNDFKKKNC